MKRKDGLPKKKRTTKYILCDKCNDSFGSEGYKNHYSKCNGVKKKNKLSINAEKIKNGYLCLECNKEFAEKGIFSHFWRKHTEKGKELKSSYGMKGKKGGNQFTKAKEMGLPKPEVSIATRQLISINSKGQVWSEERKKQHSLAMKEAVQNNPESYSSKNVCGRVKNINHNGFTLKGSWEVLVAKCLDESSIKWTNIIAPFNYFWNDSWHLYFPDFYLEEFDLYIEIKGYETDRDKAKWEVMKDKRFCVIKEAEIKKLKNNISIKEIIPL